MKVLSAMALASCIFAQDERRVASPNGQIEFRLFVATQDNTNLSRIAYEVFYHGKLLIKTSYLGLDIYIQEPLLGENDGLTSSNSALSPSYNSLVARYMQNGSLGRLIDVEVRAYNDGVAFRYIIPPSTPVIDLLIDEEATEFRFTQAVNPPLFEIAGTWVKIGESASPTYPPMHLIHEDPSTLLTRLDRKFQGAPPLTCPWRTIGIDSNREKADHFSVK